MFCWVLATKSTPIYLLDVIGSFSPLQVRSLAKGARVCNSIVKNTRTIRRVVDRPESQLLSLFEKMTFASATFKIAQNISWFLPLGSVSIYKGISTSPPHTPNY